LQVDDELLGGLVAGEGGGEGSLARGGYLQGQRFGLLRALQHQIDLVALIGAPEKGVQDLRKTLVE
jgi:hypothetical protein